MWIFPTKTRLSYCTYWRLDRCENVKTMFFVRVHFFPTQCRCDCSSLDIPGPSDSGFRSLNTAWVRKRYTRLAIHILNEVILYEHSICNARRCGLCFLFGRPSNRITPQRGGHVKKTGFPNAFFSVNSTSIHVLRPSTSVTPKITWKKKNSQLIFYTRRVWCAKTKYTFIIIHIYIYMCIIICFPSCTLYDRASNNLRGTFK